MELDQKTGRLYCATNKNRQKTLEGVLCLSGHNKKGASRTIK